VPTFIELLEEIAGARPAITIPSAEVERLVERFGARVRQMGRWNASTDGSLNIPITVIREAATELGHSAAASLIGKIRDAYDRHFRHDDGPLPKYRRPGGSDAPAR
jgi:hypothetical protein